MTPVRADILVAGRAGAGDALVLGAPISFWGGVDPRSGTIADVRHPDHGRSVAGRILCLPGTIGSSSAAAVLLELVHAKRAPAGLILHQPDAILLLGLIVAREMGLDTPMALRLDRSIFPALTGHHLMLADDGTITVARGDPRHDPG